MIYYPLLNSLFRENLRNIDQKIKDVFFSQSMGSFSSACKFSTFWVEPKTYDLNEGLAHTNIVAIIIGKIAT